VLGLNRSGLRIRKGEAPISFIKGIVGTRVVVTSTLQGVRRLSLNADVTDDAMENHEKLMAALLEARRAMMDGRWEDAWQGYEHTLHYDRRNTEALCGLGEAGFRQKKFEDGRAYFQQAIDIDSRNTQALNGLGRFHLWEQKFEMARIKFNAVLAIDPDNLEAWNGLADAYGALDSLSVQDYRDIVKGILTHFSFHDIYKLRFGNVPFEFWLKDEARRTGTRFRVKGIAGLTVMLNTIFSGDTSEQSLRMFLDEYVASNIVQNYLQHTMNLVLTKPSLNRVKADLYHMARDFREPEGYLKRLQIYLNGLENVFEETQATLPERIKNAGVTWQPGILPNDFKSQKRYKILQTQSVRKFMASFSAPDDRDKMEGNEFIEFEDAKSGLVIWGNRIPSFPTTYLYDNSDLRSIVLGNRWKEQEGHIGQVLIGFRRAGVKVPVAMVQAAGDGEAVFIFMSPEDVSAILASVVHTDPRVFSTVDFIRQEIALPMPDPELVPAAMSLIDHEAEQLNGMLSLMVNVRGASGSIIAQTDEHYYIQSARHVVAGPGQFLDNETINVSFYAEQFNIVYPAEVVNRGVFFEGGASAGFSDDTLILRIARNSIPENVRSRIGRPILANLRQGPPRVWSPYQAVAFIALSGTGGAKTPVISYGYTTVVPPGSLDDADRTVNIPVMVRSELGFSGGPLVTMFSGNMAIVGSRTCPGWSSQIRLGYFTPILKYVEELMQLTGISSSSRDQAMISDADAPEELPLNDALRLSHQPAYTIPPFVSRQALGLMPSAVDKWELRDGKINIVYNPDHVDPRYFPTALKGSSQVFISYSYDGESSIHKVPMVRNIEGLWQIALSDADGHVEINYTFNDGQGKKDTQSYKVYLFLDNNQDPVVMIDGHAHTHINLEQGDTEMFEALVAGGMDMALFFDRHNRIARDFLHAYPQLKALAWVTLSNRPAQVSTTKKMPLASSPVEIMRLLQDDPGFVGLKLHPTIDQVPVNDERVKVFLRGLSTLKHPQGIKYVVLIHGAVKYGEPRQIRELAQEFPDLNFVLGHIFIDNNINGKDTWPQRLEAIEMARDFGNVYLETSWAPQDVIMKAIEIAGAAKVIFGSDVMSRTHYSENDYYGKSYQDLIIALHKKLSLENFSLVISRNAERLFGFDMAQTTGAADTGGIDLGKTFVSFKLREGGQKDFSALAMRASTNLLLDGFIPVVTFITPVTSGLFPNTD